MKAAIACGHEQVACAAQQVLEAGGNAYDATVAAGFAAAVAEPGLTSLGGGGFLLASTAEGRRVLFDFFVDTPGRGASHASREPHFLPVIVRFPASEQTFNCGLGSAAVPGNLRGYLHVHARLGRLPISDVLAPAVALARDGVELNETQAYVLGLLRPIMTLSAAGRALYAPAGRYVGARARVRNAPLVSFLETVAAEGDGELYEGGLGRRVARDMRDGGGAITETDLAAYRVIERVPLAVGYRGRTVLTNPPPAFGGSLLSVSLRLLESADVRALGYGSAGHLLALVAVMQEVDRLRPRAIMGEIDDETLAACVARTRTFSRGTTHVSISDRDGNVASMTTSNGEGSGYFVPDTGIMLNNMLGEDDLHPDGFHAFSPGMRVASMMSPSVIVEADRVRAAVGSGGSKRIRTAMLQVISNVVDFDMPLAGAVAAARVHWDGELAQIEPGFPAAAVDALSARSPANVWDVRNIYFGGAHAVAPEGEAAGDPRRGGVGLVLDAALE